MSTSAGAGPAVSRTEEIAFKGNPKDPQDVRLRAALLDAQRRYQLVKRKPEATAAVSSAVEGAAKCLERAVQEAVRGARYSAWDCIHQFDDEMLEALSAEELQASWFSLREEVKEKLSGWRRKAADELVASIPDGKPVLLPVAREVQRHLMTVAQNQQYKIVAFEAALSPWTWAMLFFVAVVFALSAHGSFASESLLSRQWANALAIGVFAGGLGGLLSVAFSLGRIDLAAKIPAMRMSQAVTSMRPVLGAVVAIPVVFFVESDYVKIEGFVRPLSTFAFCFVAGFSERWFLGLMERFESEKK